ncbi:MAG: hypothetical protein ABH885_04890, partial [Candidatus Omnitrophota bacterium]
MEKISYGVDPQNRLIAEKTGKKSKLSYYRQVIEGRFKTGKDNSLVYVVRKPAGRYDIPNQFRLKGNWSLGGGNGLEFILAEEGKQDKQKLELRGEVIDSRKDALLFAVTTKESGGRSSSYILELQGVWQADGQNRLVFMVKREKEKYDVLTFTGRWEIGRYNELVYKYEKHDVPGKNRGVQSLSFNGVWKLGERGQLAYALDAGSGPMFSFKVSYNIFRGNYIEYGLGAGVSGDAGGPPSIKLTGRWRLIKGLGLLFDIVYRDGRVYSLKFDIETGFVKGQTVTVRLKRTLDKKDLELSFKIKKTLAKGDGELFLDLIKSSQENAVMAGMG